VNWQPFAAAAIAPLSIWLLWRLQTVSGEVLRGRLLVLTRRRDQRWMYAIVSWFGTFLHEVSHATVLLLSGHGVRRFRAGVEEGHVLPRRMRGGVGMLFFLAAALAPLFIPPALALAVLWWALGVLPDPFLVGDGGLAGFLEAARPALLDLPRRLLVALANLDFTNWTHGLALAAVLLFAPGSRPSHVKSRYHGEGDEGDVPALRRHIREQPLPFILFLAVVYGAYFAAHWLPAAYWYPVQAVWAVAATGILLALVGALFWILPGLDGRASPVIAWLGPASFAGVQVLVRLLEVPLGLAAVNGLAAATWLAVALVAASAWPRR
jgi:hypothetical protein